MPRTLFFYKNIIFKAEVGKERARERERER
jgi:hypothetical protein